MKVSVLMPTYNDDKYISKAIESVLNQKEVEIELIIINDGSCDETEDIVLSYKDERIKYIKQENKGQLEAVLNGSRHVTGDFVCLFHSDDIIVDEFSFKRNAMFIMQHNLDGVYSDYIKINSRDEEIGKLNVIKTFGKETLEKLIQMRGSNVIGDPFFVKKNVFFKFVVKNYVVWNEPYWFTIAKEKIDLLKLKYINHPWYKYRVYGENYVRSDIGKFVATNGVIRTMIDLSRFYKFRFPNFRFVHRLPTSLVVKPKKVINGSSENIKTLGKLIARILLKDYKVDVEKNVYYKALLNFYTMETNTILDLDDDTVERAPLFVGKDVNVFYTMMVNGSLPELYQLLLNNALKGYFTVKISEKYRKKVELILKFINFNASLRIK